MTNGGPGSLIAGAGVPELATTPDADLTLRYASASGDFNPIHTDDEFARAAGLPGRILHGLWTMAQAARAQTSVAGPLGLRSLEVEFRAVGVPGAEVVVRSTVARIDDGIARVELTVEQGDRTLIKNGVAEVET